MGDRTVTDGGTATDGASTDEREDALAGAAAGADGPTSVGIVGLGNIGCFHTDNLRRLSGEFDAELAGGMDVDGGARERFAEEYGAPTFAEPSALFDAADAVVITTPNRFHEEYAVGALEASCHVLVEKPVAHTVESARRVVAAATDSDRVCMVGFHNRFADPVQVLASYIEDGRFGEVSHVEASYVRRRGIPGRGTWFTDGDVAGGGALIDIGAHTIDLALYLAGFPAVREVTGVTRSTFGAREDYACLDMWGEDAGTEFDVDDSASAFLRCEGGTTISLEVAWAANREPTQEMVVRGEDAGATLDFDGGDLVVHEVDDGGATHFADTRVTTDTEDPHVEELRRFLGAARTGEQPALNTPEQGLAVQRVIDAIYRSSDTGGAVAPANEPASADD